MFWRVSICPLKAGSGPVLPFLQAGHKPLRFTQFLTHYSCSFSNLTLYNVCGWDGVIKYIKMNLSFSARNVKSVFTVVVHMFICLWKQNPRTVKFWIYKCFSNNHKKSYIEHRQLISHTPQLFLRSHVIAPSAN